MKRKTEIEATLDRSLRNQVKVPRLNGRFDAAVWARIESEEPRRATAALPVRAAASRSARWLSIFNALGLASVAIFGSFYAAQMLAGENTAISLPEFSATTIERIAMALSFAIAGISMIFGVLFTPWGRRLRDELI
jgi:hypothetical protein